MSKNPINPTNPEKVRLILDTDMLTDIIFSLPVIIPPAFIFFNETFHLAIKNLNKVLCFCVPHTFAHNYLCFKFYLLAFSAPVFISAVQSV